MKLLAMLLLASFTAQAAVPVKPRWTPSADWVVEILKMPPETRHQSLYEQPDSVYPVLIGITKDKERPMPIRWRALTAAAVYKREKARPDLLEASKSTDWFMRNAALVALSEYSPKDAVSVATELIRDPALVVRSASVTVLAKHGGEASRPLLWQQLDADHNRRGNTSLWIRGQIAKFLAEKPVEGELPKFSRMLSDKDEALQKVAVLGLQNMTGLHLGDGISSHTKVVELWKNYFNRPASKRQ